MAQHSVAPSVNTPVRLTEKEWTEIRECTSALHAVVGIFLELPGRAEVGGIEALRSVQRRLELTVTLAENRMEGKGMGECPLCGRSLPENPEDDPPQGTPTAPTRQPDDPDSQGQAESCSLCG